MVMLKSLPLVLAFLLSVVSADVIASQNTSEVKVTVDRNPVRVNETFEMTVHMDAAPVTQPEITGLPADLEVLRNSNFYTKRTVNGQASIQAGWRYTIKALSEGIFTIPSFEVDGKRTTPLTVKVLEAVSSTNVNGQPDAIRITADLNSDSVYVQQQLIYSIKLYRAVQAQYASLTEPVLEGALIEVLGDDVQYETNIDGVRYLVLERRYAIFPQQSGEFTISGVTYNAEVSTGRRQFSTMGSLRSRSRSISLSTEDKIITVKPIPAGVTDWWLPANDVRLEESWSASDNIIEAGTPVTWTYSIIADGLTATQIPDRLPEEIQDLKFYPEQARDSNSVVDGQMYGKRTQTIAVIATRPGEITLPTIELNWWDVEADQPRTISLPPRILTVTGAAPTGIIQPSAPTPQPEAQLTAPAVSELDNLGSSEAEQTDMSQLRLWQLATFLMVLVWLVTLIWKRRNQVPGESTENTVTKPITESAVTIDELAKTIAQSDLQKVYQQLVQHFKQYDAKIRSLRDVITKVEDEELKSTLEQIDASRFSAKSSDWSLTKQQLIQVKDQISRQNTIQSSQQDNLGPLHPEH